MGEIQFTNSLIMIGLFTIAIITFAINFAGDNDAVINLANDGDFVNTNATVYGNVSDWNSEDVNYISSAYQNTSASGSSDVTEQGGQFKVGVGSSLGITTSILRNSFNKIFGQDSGFGIFLTTLAGILLFMFVRYQYKTWFGKQPD